MARNAAPGWYSTPDGRTAYWDGKIWTGRARPAAPTDRSEGWKVQDAETYRWWTGDHWSDARAAVDGHVDVLENIGQAIISGVVLGGGDAQVIEDLYQALVDYPPCRVEQLQTYTSAVAPGTNLVAIVSWVGPKAH